MQIKPGMVERLEKLWEERPPRYSRALFETLALVAYRQPITRGEIEEIRGVSVSSNIVRSLLERDWVRVVGHRDVPGRPAMFGTTKAFLDYFGLMKLDDLPPLADLSDWESLRVQLNLPDVGSGDDEAGPESGEVTALPVVYPDLSEEAISMDTIESEMSDDDSIDFDDIPQADPDTAFTEIVASEWPDPLETDDESEGPLDDGLELDVGPDRSASRR